MYSDDEEFCAVFDYTRLIANQGDLDGCGLSANFGSADMAHRRCRLDRQRARMVRSAGLRVSRGHHLPPFLPVQRRKRILVAGARDIRRFLSDSAAWRSRAWRLRGSQWTEGVALGLDPADDDRHLADGGPADLPFHRSFGASWRLDRPVTSGVFDRRGVRQWDVVSRRTRSGSKGLLRQLSMGRTGVGGRARVRIWDRASHSGDATPTRLPGDGDFPICSVF